MSRRVLITGASRRIGRAIALELAAAGWDVILHYHHGRNEAVSLSRDIQRMGQSAALAELDLSDPRLVEKLIPSLTESLGPLSALVNNAALFEPDATDADGSRHRLLNVEAPRILSESFFDACRRQMAASGLASKAGGAKVAPPAIVNLLDANPASPGFTRYNRSKKRLAALTSSMAARFAPLVRVNGVAPGIVLPSPRQSAEHFQRMAEASPFKTPIAPEFVAEAVRFLIESPAITGEILRVDGGLGLARSG